MCRFCVAANGAMCFSCVALATHFFIREGKFVFKNFYYKKMYFRLFNRITDALEILEKSTVLSEEIMYAIGILKKAQIETEEMYVSRIDE